MNLKSKIILAIGLVLTLLLSYLFIPTTQVKKIDALQELEAPFLKTDPYWADSVLLNLSDEEKLAQLFIPSIDVDQISDSFEINFKESNAFGFAFNPADIEKQISIVKRYNEKNNFPAFFSSNNVITPFKNNYSLNESTLFSISDTSLIRLFQNEYINRNNKYGLNLLKGFDCLYYDSLFSFYVSERSTNFILPIIRKANEEHLLFACGKLKKTYDIQQDSLFENDTIIKVYKQFSDSGMTVLLVDSSYYNWKNNNKGKPVIKSFCEDRLDFKGLIAVEFPQQNIDEKKVLAFFLQEGVDLIYTGKNHFKIVAAAKKMLQEKLIDVEQLNKKVHKILLARSWIKEKNYPTQGRLNEMQLINDPLSKVMGLKLNEASVTLIHNKNNSLPLVLNPEKLPIVIEIGTKDESFRRESENYSAIRQNIKLNALEELEKLNTKSLQQSHQLIVCLYNQFLDSSNSKQLTVFSELQKNKKVIVANCGSPKNILFLNQFNCILQLPGANPEQRKSLSRAIFGANSICGKTDYQFSNLKRNSGLALHATRLKHGIPEEAGINKDSLFKIDYIMDEGIRNRAFPGGQVFLALDGIVIYHKVFGHHTYAKKIAVKAEHYYDLASITKVTATTLMAMHLYEKQYYRLDDSLKKYLPDTLKRHLPNESTLRNVTFRQLLIHASGLPAGQNIIRFIRFNDPTERYDYYFCDEKSELFQLDLADSFYVDNRCLDSLWLDLNKIWLNENKPYCYSDANMNLLYTVLRPMIGKQKWDRYLDSVFYSPMGMKHTTFNPLKKKIEKNQIAPTEEDRYWRKDLLQGHVHDPTAALYGGVAGNAGLFSNAYDMGIFCQMLLNKGHYGGIRFFESKTVDLFTSQQNGTHRGLGFNRQVSGSTYGCSPYASDQTYGHTGFTGTAFWVDPKLKFIYVFITNRVHPDPENKTIIKIGTTKRVHNVVYELLFPEEKQDEPI